MIDLYEYVCGALRYPKVGEGFFFLSVVALSLKSTAVMSSRERTPALYCVSLLSYPLLLCYPLPLSVSVAIAFFHYPNTKKWSCSLRCARRPYMSVSAEGVVSGASLPSSKDFTSFWTTGVTTQKSLKKKTRDFFLCPRFRFLFC